MAVAIPVGLGRPEVEVSLNGSEFPACPHDEVCCLEHLAPLVYLVQHLPLDLATVLE